MSKKKKKYNQRTRNFIMAIGLLICCCIMLTILFYEKVYNKEIYKIESRVENISKEKKKDEDGYKTIGWLRVQGTNIDTPIINYTTEEGTRLDKENFLWNINGNEKLYNKVNILGHNILNLSSTPLSGKEYFSRFEDLMSFVYPEFVENNKYIQYTIDGEDYIYKVFAVDFIDQYDIDIHSKTNYDEEALKDYIDYIKEESIYDFDVDVNEKDKFISLITCTRMFGRNAEEEFVVTGRLVRDNEKMSNYSSETNANYKEIEKIMEGDDKNEKA